MSRQVDRGTAADLAWAPLDWLLLLGVLAAQLFAAPKGLSVAVVFAWLLLLDVFGSLVPREQQTRTAEPVFTTPSAHVRLPVTRAVVSVCLAWT